MDSSLTNNLPDPVVNFTDATDPFDLYKATLGRVLFFKGNPKLYTIEPYVYSKRAGLVAALSLAKFTTGYFILWNVQVNTNELLDSDVTALTFFTPTWYASSAKNTTQLNFICQN
jgi:predicted Kef-type K+ transport protein